MDKKEAFGLFVAQRRSARGLTQDALAKAVDISRPYLTQIENGKRMPSDEKFMALLVALGASFEEFVREIGDGLIPEEQIESMAVLLRFVDVLQKYLTPEQIAEVMEAAPTPAQVDASLSSLGGLPLEPSPDGWAELTKEDRRLVQRLINRLRKGLGTGGGDDGDAEA